MANVWMVVSMDIEGKFYRVDITESGFKCDCPYHQKRKASASTYWQSRCGLCRRLPHRTALPSPSH